MTNSIGLIPGCKQKEKRKRKTAVFFSGPQGLSPEWHSTTQQPYFTYCKIQHDQ